MHVAIVGTDQLCQIIADRLVKEGISVERLDANPQSLSHAVAKKPFDLLLALDNSDETNLVSCALVKQIAQVKTIASLKSPSYLFQKELDLQRAFHIDHVVFPDLLVVDKIAERILEEGIYSRNFLHGNVQLRTIQVTEGCSVAGKTLAEVRDVYPDLLVCLIHRPRKILASSKDRALHLVGKSDELIFAHGGDLLLPDDEITMIGKTDTVVDASRQIRGESKMTRSVCIVGGGSISQALTARLLQHHFMVRQEERDVKFDELNPNDVFVACHREEEHNFVLAVQAKDRGIERVIALLSDPATCEEAEKLGIQHVVGAPTSATDRLLELVQGGKITRVCSLYNARAEILQVSVAVDSPSVGIPLSVLGPTLPKEMLIGVIYTRGRVFIAGGSHILKPQDECLVVIDPKHRPLLEKIF